MPPLKPSSTSSGVKFSSVRWCSFERITRMLFSAWPVRFGTTVALPICIRPSGKKSFVNMGVLVCMLSGQKGQVALVFSIKDLSSWVSVVRNLLMLLSIPLMTVVFLPVSGSVLYSKVIVSSWKFLSGFRIFACLMVFSKVITAACLFLLVVCRLLLWS